ncbi:hypothetical protein HZ994_16240 [Akkermansiaceae bacterium]|nr:hypothetical protein HZ994_16240 [Akkermansiaceae bacterium]
MNSPLGNHTPLESVTLPEGLNAYRCPETGGLWIPAECYWLWQRSLPPEADHGHHETHELPRSEFDDTAKFCPESGTIMSRYKVGHGLDFRIERSVTGGIWLDPGEWEALTAGNLHQELHLVFTSPWQKAIRDESREHSYESMLREKLGGELHQRLADLRADLANHPSKAVAIAYLQG